MPIDDRDYFRSRSGRREHPPACTCHHCTTARLREVQARNRRGRPAAGGSSQRPQARRPAARAAARPAGRNGSSKRFWLVCLAMVVGIYGVFVAHFTYQAYIENPYSSVGDVPGIAASEVLTPAMVTVKWLGSSNSERGESLQSPPGSPPAPPPEGRPVGNVTPDGDSNREGEDGFPLAAALETSSPASEPTTVPATEATPEPGQATSPTITSTPTSTPAPMASRFGEIAPHRIVTVSQLYEEPRFWKDGRPFALLGCQDDSRTDDGYYGVTQSGQSRLVGDLTMVRGDFLSRDRGEGRCYEMLVSYLDTRAYCYHAGRFATPGRFVHCAEGTSTVSI